MTEADLFSPDVLPDLDALNRAPLASDMAAAEALRHTRSFDAISPRPPEFLWYPYVRAANLNLLSGDGGSGKTTLALMLATALADGARPETMPGTLHTEAARGTHTLILSFEDEPSELRHRLDGCGCRHPERIHTLKPDESAPTLTEESILEALVRECGARLLIIDPVQAFLRAGTDANSMSDVRQALESVRRVCTHTGCSALLLAHLNKSTGRGPMQRTSGSMDFVNASRSALMVVRHPTLSDQRCMLHFKANGAALGDTVSFTLGEGARAEFSGICTLSREELLAQGAGPDNAENTVSQVRRLLDRVTKACPEWELTAAELSERPENPEDLSPRTISHSLRQSAAALGLALRIRKHRNRLCYSIDWSKTENRE